VPKILSYEAGIVRLRAGCRVKGHFPVGLDPLELGSAFPLPPDFQDDPAALMINEELAYSFRIYVILAND